MHDLNGLNRDSGEWNDSLRGEFLWSSVNVSEAVPDVMTPCTWSLWQIFYRDANPIRIPGDYPFCGNICGRPYLNLSLVVSLYRAIGKDMRQELHGDFIGSAPTDLEAPIIHFSPFAVIWTVLPGMLKAQRYAGQDQQRIPRFTAETPGWCRELQVQIKGTAGTLNLLAIWQEIVKPYFFQASRLLRSVTMSFSDSATKLRLKLIRLVGEPDANTIMSNLAGEPANLDSLGPLVGLTQLAQGRIDRATYLERYGHRGPHEMELSSQGVEEDPEWLDKRLAEFSKSPVHVEELLAKQRNVNTCAWQRFETQHPKKAHVFQVQLEKVAAAARTREAVRSEFTRLTRLVRQFLLHAGELTGFGEGVFFLSLDELSTVLAGDEKPVANIPARREIYTRYCSLPTYPAIIIGQFDPFIWAADPARRSDYYDGRQTKTITPPITITGFAGAAGVVEGIVRRLDKPEDETELLPGEILVTSTTNVGWTPLFPRLAAIITDVGAPLSHAAIVARELGIPAVVGCGNATAILKTGDRVRVDGGAGSVTIL